MIFLTRCLSLFVALSSLLPALLSYFPSSISKVFSSVTSNTTFLFYPYFSHFIPDVPVCLPPCHLSFHHFLLFPFSFLQILPFSSAFSYSLPGVPACLPPCHKSFLHFLLFPFSLSFPHSYLGIHQRVNEVRYLETAKRNQ